MKGNNSLILNQATMIEAVQYWLNAQMASKAPRVVEVKHEDKLMDTFRVSLDSGVDGAIEN